MPAYLAKPLGIYKKYVHDGMIIVIGKFRFKTTYEAMKDLSKIVEQAINEEVRKLKGSLETDFNTWINRFVETHQMNPKKIEVNQDNQSRFAEVFYEDELVGYATLENNGLRFYELI